MNRRNFIAKTIAGLLAFFGVKQAKASAPAQPQINDGLFKYCQQVQKAFLDRGVQVQTLFAKQLMDQISLTGTGLVWMIPNILGNIMEVYVLKTTDCVPRSATEDHPCGYYNCFANGKHCMIPAQFIIRVDCPANFIQTGIWLKDINESLNSNRHIKFKNNCHIGKPVD